MVPARRSYQYLNAAVEAPYLWTRLATLYLDWGNSLFRADDAHAALPVYVKVLTADSRLPARRLYTSPGLAPAATAARNVIANLDEPGGDHGEPGDQRRDLRRAGATGQDRRRTRLLGPLDAERSDLDLRLPAVRGPQPVPDGREHRARRHVVLGQGRQRRADTPAAHPEHRADRRPSATPRNGRSLPPNRSSASTSRARRSRSSARPNARANADEYAYEVARLVHASGVVGAAERRRRRQCRRAERPGRPHAAGRLLDLSGRPRHAGGGRAAHGLAAAEPVRDRPHEPRGQPARCRGRPGGRRSAPRPRRA